MTEIDFVWPVAQAGHCLTPVPLSALGDSGQFLATFVCTSPRAASLDGCDREQEVSTHVGPDAMWICPADAPARFREHWRPGRPLQTKATLFRTFADLCSNEQSLLHFADRFGLLTDPEHGEPISVWKAAVSELRSAVQRWEDCVLTVKGEAGVGNTAALRLASAKPSDQGTDSGTGHQKIILLHDERYRKEIDVLVTKINEKISRVPIVIVFDFDVALDFAIRLRPTTLLEAMWLEFALAVASNKLCRKCRNCGDWFDVSVGSARSDKVFCSEACKARAYRQRLAERDETSRSSGSAEDVADHQIERGWPAAQADVKSPSVRKRARNGKLQPKAL